MDTDGSLVPDQFDVTVSGIGGAVTIAGFHLDSLLIPTAEGDPLVASDPNHLRFVSAPVFVQGIELMDPVTAERFVFDGILGTNYLFGSGDLSALAGFEVPFRSGPFESLVLDFDSVPPKLGLVVAPEPTSPGSALGAAAVLALWRRRRVRRPRPSGL